MAGYVRRQDRAPVFDAHPVRYCPFCSSVVSDLAVACPYCRSALPNAAAVGVIEAPAPVVGPRILRPTAPGLTGFTRPEGATTILVLGLVGLLVCGIFGAVSLFLGFQYWQACKDRSVQMEGTAIAGIVLGSISTVVMVIGLGIVALLVALS